MKKYLSIFLLIGVIPFCKVSYAKNTVIEEEKLISYGFGIEDKNISHIDGIIEVEEDDNYDNEIVILPDDIIIEESVTEEIPEVIEPSYPYISESIKDISISVQTDESIKVSIDTNKISFINFDMTSDVEKTNALNIVVSSTSPYRIKSKIPSGFVGKKTGIVLGQDIISIKESSESEYINYPSIGEEIILVDNQPSGIEKVHSVDIKLNANSNFKKDTYNGKIRFEVNQI